MTADGDTSATVWIASVAEALALPDAVAGLDAEETARAGRFRLAADRDRFLAARALLRHALTTTVGGRIAPADWRTRLGPNDKPMMAEGLPPIAFNLSHAGDCVVAGVCACGPVGVDVESLVRDRRVGIVEEVLTDRERAGLDRLAQDRRWPAFIRTWTLKEACAKALGLGVSLDFRKLEVTLDPAGVRAADGLLAPGRAFDVVTRTLAREGGPYCLAVATAPEAARRTAYRFETLTRAQP